MTESLKNYPKRQWSPIFQTLFVFNSFFWHLIQMQLAIKFRKEQIQVQKGTVNEIIHFKR